MADFDFEINQGQNIEFDIIESSYATNAYADKKISEHNADLNAHSEIMQNKADKSNSLGGFEGGEGASAGTGVAAGYQAKTGNGVALGYLAKTVGSLNSPIDAVQIGTGTNHDEGTFQIYNYKMMDENGVIPAERLPQSVIPKTATVTVNTPAWTNQPTIEGDLNPAFLNWTHRPYWVVLKDTAGAALPENQFKLTETRDDYANAVDQIFTLSGLNAGNAGVLNSYSMVDFLSIDGNTFEMRSAGVTSINSPSELGDTYAHAKIIINGWTSGQYLYFQIMEPSNSVICYMDGLNFDAKGWRMFQASYSGNPAPTTSWNGNKFYSSIQKIEFHKTDVITGFVENSYGEKKDKIDENFVRMANVKNNFVMRCYDESYFNSAKCKIDILPYAAKNVRVWYLNGTEITWEVFE